MIASPVEKFPLARADGTGGYFEDVVENYSLNMVSMRENGENMFRKLCTYNSGNELCCIHHCCFLTHTEKKLFACQFLIMMGFFTMVDYVFHHKIGCIDIP